MTVIVHCDLLDCCYNFNRGRRCHAPDVRIDKFGDIACYEPNKKTDLTHEEFPIAPGKC